KDSAFANRGSLAAVQDREAGQAGLVVSRPGDRAFPRRGGRARLLPPVVSAPRQLGLASLVAQQNVQCRLTRRAPIAARRTLYLDFPKEPPMSKSRPVHRQLVLAVCCLSVCIAGIDVTIANV